MLKHSATFTYDPAHDSAYYFQPTNRTSPPYLTQRHVTAILDIASDGTLAGVELVMGKLPPPPPPLLAERSDATYGAPMSAIPDESKNVCVDRKTLKRVIMHSVMEAFPSPRGFKSLVSEDQADQIASEIIRLVLTAIQE